MANNKGKAAAAVVKYGVRYGPMLATVLKNSREPAKEMAGKQFARANHRRHALEHAHNLIDGSVMTVFDGDQRLYVVFNGDRPIASHPASKKPLSQLVDGYDLSKRVRADDTAAHTGVTVRLPRPVRPANPLARRRRATRAIEGSVVQDPSAGGSAGTDDAGTGS